MRYTGQVEKDKGVGINIPFNLLGISHVVEEKYGWVTPENPFYLKSKTPNRKVGNVYPHIGNVYPHIGKTHLLYEKIDEGDIKGPPLKEKGKWRRENLKSLKIIMPSSSV